MARPQLPEPLAAPSSWAALSTDGEPAAEPARADTGQMPLFDIPVAPAPPLARHARLCGRLQALLARAAAAAVVPRAPASSWPDSFFDVDDERP